MRHFSRDARLLSIVFFAIVLDGCDWLDSFFKDDDPGESYSPATVVKSNVGTSGGTVSNPKGASVAIPDGALESPAAISVSCHSSSHSFAAAYGAGLLYGSVAEFGPDGTTFIAPVTIALPVSGDFEPGSHPLLFELDPASSSWKATDFVASVSSDGATVSADVTHFTVYRCFPDFEESFKGKFAQLLSENGGDMALAFSRFIAWFYESTGLTPLEDHVIVDDGDYVLEQVFFSLLGKGATGEIDTAFQDGSDKARDAVDTVLSDSFDYLSNDKQLVWELLIVLHWELHPHGLEILTPLEGAVVKGTVAISTLQFGELAAADFLIDGALASSSTESPFSYSWETWKASAGTHKLRVIGYWDVGGERVSSRSPVRTVQVEAAGHAKIVLDPPAVHIDDRTSSVNMVEGWPPAYINLTGTLTNNGPGTLTWSDMCFGGAWDPCAGYLKDGEYRVFPHHDYGAVDPAPLVLGPGESAGIQIYDIGVGCVTTQIVSFAMDDPDLFGGWGWAFYIKVVEPPAETTR
jgi:hypothetical protein